MKLIYLLIIGTSIGLASCNKPEHRIVHEIHYVPSYGATAPEDAKKLPDDRTGAYIKREESEL